MYVTLVMQNESDVLFRAQAMNDIIHTATSSTRRYLARVCSGDGRDEDGRDEDELDEGVRRQEVKPILVCCRQRHTKLSVSRAAATLE